MYIRPYLVRCRYVYPDGGISEIKNFYYDTAKEARDMVEDMEDNGNMAEWCKTEDKNSTPSTLENLFDGEIDLA